MTRFSMEHTCKKCNTKVITEDLENGHNFHWVAYFADLPTKRQGFGRNRKEAMENLLEIGEHH